MVPELKDLEYEDRLKEMGLLTLQDRRERGDLIIMYKIISGKEKIDRQDLVILTEDASTRTRGHSKKVGKSPCSRDVKKYSFSHKTVDVWNGLREEIVEAASTHDFKKKLGKYRYGDRT